MGGLSIKHFLSETTSSEFKIEAQTYTQKSADPFHHQAGWKRTRHKWCTSSRVDVSLQRHISWTTRASQFLQQIISFDVNCAELVSWQYGILCIQWCGVNKFTISEYILFNSITSERSKSSSPHISAVEPPVMEFRSVDTTNNRGVTTEPLGTPCSSSISFDVTPFHSTAFSLPTTKGSNSPYASSNSPYSPSVLANKRVRNTVKGPQRITKDDLFWLLWLDRIQNSLEERFHCQNSGLFPYKTKLTRNQKMMHLQIL